MSDSDDDYMSFTVVEPEEDHRPSLFFNREAKRKHDIFKKQLESISKKPRTFRALEEEARDRGLNTALSSENKGFKMLEKMGFKPGESLGKSQSGIKEPIDIVLKQGTSGVGRVAHLQEVQYKKQQKKTHSQKVVEQNFRQATKERQALILLRKDFFKAQKICEELDFRKKVKEPVAEFFWTKETILKRRKANRQTEDGVVFDSDSSEEDEELELAITEENLLILIDYIRSEHLYCMYCVITCEDVEDLKENCPGPYRSDHDDE